MDSNPKQSPSRPQEADNPAKDQTDAGSSLRASCGASSSAIRPSTANDPGSGRQPSSTSRGMEETKSPLPAVAERMKGAEDQRVGASSSSSPSSSSSSPSEGRGVGEPHTARTTADDLALALHGSPLFVMTLSLDRSNNNSNNRSNNSSTSSNSSNSSSGGDDSSTTNTPVPGCSQMSGGGCACASPTTDFNKEKKKDETPTSASAMATARKEPQTTPNKGTKRSRDDVESEEAAASPVFPAKRKNRKRCFKCSCKLVLALRGIIGLCRCERVFCALHRLPELHSCDFDHKEEGRQLAREKMVKPTRHLGTSFRRLEDNSS